MISGQEMVAVLHAVSTGHVDRALNVVMTSAALEEGPLKAALQKALTDNDEPYLRAQALGDAFRDVDGDQFLVNECYRAAFYLGTDWSAMARNPLYAHFIANRAGPGLDKWVHYFPIYTRHLERFRGQPIRLLEIGVYRGGGLELWQEYFGPQATIVGVDIDEAAVRSVRGRFPVLLGDQEDPEFLQQVNDEYGPFDVIIDDGGHTMRQQIVSAETLFPLVVDGGVYIVEDGHTSYWTHFGGQLHSPESFVEWSKLHVDDMHSRHHAGIDRNTIWATHLDGLAFYDSVVVFEKVRRFRPFNEMVGTSSYLFADRFSEGLGIELLATRDAAIRERDELREKVVSLTALGPEPDYDSEPTDLESTSEELRLARAELRRARARAIELGSELESKSSELTITREQLNDSWALVKAMRRTLSWRVTRPLRLARRIGLK